MTARFIRLTKTDNMKHQNQNVIEKIERTAQHS